MFVFIVYPFCPIAGQLGLGNELERQLLLEAGAELSACGANYRSLGFFGLRWMEGKRFEGALQKLKAWGLPMMVSPSESQLEENDHVISTMFARSSGTKHRRLVMAFDRTYLTRSFQFCKGEDGASLMLGGVHRPPHFQLPDESKLKLVKEDGQPECFSKDRFLRANEMESYLIWDCSRSSSSCIMEIGAFPVTSSASVDTRFESLMGGETKRCRGKWEVLCRLGMLLEAASSVKFLLCDGATSHEWMHKLLLGKPCSLPCTALEMTPFFSKLRFSELPSTSFSLLHRIVRLDGQSFHYVPGPAHLQKNVAEQLRSVTNTPTFGLKFADSAAGLEAGLLPTTFSGTDTMSDLQGALWCPVSFDVLCWCLDFFGFLPSGFFVFDVF